MCDLVVNCLPRQNFYKIKPKVDWIDWIGLNWLFNVTINGISVIYVTAHRCAGGLKKKLDLRSGIDISQGSLTCPS